MFNLIANATRRSAMAAVTRPTTLAPAASGFFLRAFSDEAAGKMKGTVKWFDARKGFGFLVPDDETHPEVFVHHSAIHANGFRTLGDGESVEFEVITEPNGKCKAIHVTGPDGGYVQGAPRRMDSGGYGGGEGGGYGGGYNDGGGY